MASIGASRIAAASRVACRSVWSKCLQNKPKEKIFATYSRYVHFTSSQNYPKSWVEVTFKCPNGEKVNVSGKEGETLLDLVVNNDLDFPGFGACEGTLGCSTCHVVLTQEGYDYLAKTQPADIEEDDMVEMAYGLTDTSRLGCQVCLLKGLEGLEVTVPKFSKDVRDE